ncbi:hypothetical protein Vafri_1664 [Volvox africanus]|nr:hypothetical protein Vafri_1664 [Volvox africanus]
MYLAAAGVGRLGLVDHDGVDVTNLHRQVMHTTSRVGLNKAVSGRITCTAINPTIQVEAHTRGFTPTNALELVERYDVVVDATDNPATRYLVSDACVVSGKPLVSAAAVGTDGQLTVYNYGNGGPCYRCLFPEAPAPENCSRCGEAGVLGVVPGIMGCLQALEAIKILSGVGDVSSKKLTIFDALAGRFTTVRLRNRNPTCVACGSSPVITRTTLPSYDYVLFTGQPPDDGPPADLELIDPRFRLKPQQVARILAAQMEMDVEATAEQCREAVMAEPEAAIGKAGPGLVERFSACEREEQQQGRARQGDQQSQQEEMHATVNQIVDSDSYRDGRVDREQTLFLDVRPTTQYNIMALPGVMHVPYERLEERLPELLAMLGMGTRVSDSAAASSPTGVAADMEATVIGSPHSGAVAMATITTAAAAASCAAVASAAEPLARGVAIGSGSTGNAAGGEAEAGGSQPRVVVLCRRGNNSQRVVARLAGLGVKGVTDMQGGYMAWAKQVDPDMPLL